MLFLLLIGDNTYAAFRRNSFSAETFGLLKSLQAPHKPQ